MVRFQYKNQRPINSKNYKGLNDIQLQQLAISATLSFGEAFTTAEHFLEQTGNGNIADGYAELWDVVERNNPESVLYEAWFYQFDNANVFFAKTTRSADAIMRKGSVLPQTIDESCKTLCADLKIAYYSKGQKSYQTAKKIECTHLQPIETYLKKLGIAETYRGQPWSDNCREWVYFDCVLNAAQLKKRFKLGDKITIHDYFDIKVGSELGLKCEECHDAIIGPHPNK